MELLGVVKDLSEWTRLGRTSWLKCYDVLGYGNADQGQGDHGGGAFQEGSTGQRVGGLAQAAAATR